MEMSPRARGFWRSCAVAPCRTARQRSTLPRRLATCAAGRCPRLARRECRDTSLLWCSPTPRLPARPARMAPPRLPARPARMAPPLALTAPGARQSVPGTALLEPGAPLGAVHAAIHSHDAAGIAPFKDATAGTAPFKAAGAAVVRGAGCRPARPSREPAALPPAPAAGAGGQRTRRACAALPPAYLSGHRPLRATAPPACSAAVPLTSLPGHFRRRTPRRPPSEGARPPGEPPGLLSEPMFVGPRSQLLTLNIGKAS